MNSSFLLSTRSVTLLRVKFSIGQNVAVTPDAAVAAYGNPAFYEGRASSGDISLVELVHHEDTGTQARIEVRYQFTGSVSSAVRAVIDPAKMSWVTRTDIDKAQRRTSLHRPARLLPRPPRVQRHVHLRRGGVRPERHGGHHRRRPQGARLLGGPHGGAAHRQRTARAYLEAEISTAARVHRVSLTIWAMPSSIPPDRTSRSGVVS